MVSRAELARAAGLDGLSERRVDGVLVRLRRVLPDGALVTVRRRGWALLTTAHDSLPAPTSCGGGARPDADPVRVSPRTVRVPRRTCAGSGG